MSKLYRINKAVDFCKTAQKKRSHIDVAVNGDGSVLVYDANCNVIRQYIPHETFKIYHADDAQIKILRGAFGSGKSTANMIREVIAQAVNMPKCVDGIRRARTVIIRNTMKELKETVIDLWDTWCSSLGNVKTHESVPLSYEHNFRDKNGLIHLEVWFLAIDKQKQLRDMKSMQMTNALLSELSELPETVLSYAIARVGRYPAKILLPPDHRNYKCHVWADTNADNDDHWMYTRLQADAIEITGNCEDDYKIYKKHIAYEVFKEKKTIDISIYEQPPALLEAGKKSNGKINWVSNPKAENIEFLEGGFAYYFRQLANGDEFVKVFACGRPGIVRDGLPVYPSFSEQIHATDNIAIDSKHDLLVGVDFGYDCPAFLVAQYIDGQLRAIKEFWGRSLYIEELYTIEVEPWLKTNAFGLAYRAFDDPANTMHGRQELLKCGFESNAAISNKLEDRLPIVNQLLTQLVRGKGALLVSKEGCPSLYAGFVGKYVFEMVKIVGSDRAKKTPRKEHPVSDVHDALGYIAQSVRLGLVATKQKDFSDFINRDKY